MLLEAAFAYDASTFCELIPCEGGVAQPQGNSPFSSLFLLGVAIAVFAAFLRRWSFCVMGRHFTYQLSILEDHQLVTHGPYAYVRHPGYTALVMSLIGTFMCELSSEAMGCET